MSSAPLGARLFGRAAIVALLLSPLLIIESPAAATQVEAQPAEPMAACIAYGDACSEGDKCCATNAGPGVCHAFGRGPRCTIPCPADPDDCPNGGRGCNNQSPPMCRSGKGRGGGKKK